jgi:hypothetical protein
MVITTKKTNLISIRVLAILVPRLLKKMTLLLLLLEMMMKVMTMRRILMGY